MKRLTINLLMVGLCAGMLLAQAEKKAAETKKPASSASAVADELKQLENDWADAQKNRNAEKLGDILADTWVGLGWDGKRMTKTKALAEVKSSNTSLDSIEMGPMTVRAFGNAAVVTGSDTEKSMENGKDTSGRYVWTDVFVKHNGKWQAVASQSTKLPK